MDKLKECLTTRNSAKWARKGNHHIEILLSSHGEEKKNLEGLLWGVKDQEAHVNIYIGPRAQSKEEPLFGHGKNLSSAKYGREQRERLITERGTPGHSMEHEKY